MSSSNSLPSVNSETGIEALSLESVQRADHPAVARAVAEILSGQHFSAGFSSFTSHSSAVGDEADEAK